MSEGEVVEQLVEFTNILLAGVSLIFSIVSAYVVALNYFIGSANLPARIASFAFMTLILGMLFTVMLGAQDTHVGLVARLRELETQHQLTAAGRALPANASSTTVCGSLRSDRNLDTSAQVENAFLETGGLSAGWRRFIASQGEIPVDEGLIGSSSTGPRFCSSQV